MTKKSRYTRRQVISNVAATTVAATTVTFPDETVASTAQFMQSRRWRVREYQFGWNHIQRKGTIRLFLENYNQNPVVLNVGESGEFTCYVAILRESPVFFDSSGWLSIGYTPTR